MNRKSIFCLVVLSCATLTFARAQSDFQPGIQPDAQAVPVPVPLAVPAPAMAPLPPLTPLPPIPPPPQVAGLALPRLALNLPILLGLQPLGGGQVKDDLFAGTEKFAQGASDVTEVNLDPSMMGSVSGAKGEAARKMDFMIVRTYKYDKPGMYKQEDVDVYRKRLADGTWNCSVHVRSKDKSTDICSRAGADHETNETVIITSEPLSLSFIHMRGRESLGDLDKLTPRRPVPPPPPAKPETN